MRRSAVVDLVYWGKVISAIMAWLWLFRDHPLVWIVAGSLASMFGLLDLLKPSLSPNRGGMFNARMPDALFDSIQKTSAFVWLVLGILILSGIRPTMVEHVGWAGVVIAALMLACCLHWLRISEPAERRAVSGWLVWSIILFGVMLIVSAFFIRIGDRPVRLFVEMSPVPMMVVFFLLFAAQYVVIRRRERRTARVGPGGEVRES